MFKHIALFISLTLIGGGLLLQYYTKSKLPQYSGELSLSGLVTQVNVTRDKWGVPHIYASNELDAQRALGFTMAADRLFQMDILRRLVNGELSEILGPKTLQLDILLRKLRIRAHMNESWRSNRYKMDSQMVALMNAFLEGVHHYMQTQPLPLEFDILGYRPRPFTIEESLGISGFLALNFAEGIIADTLYTDLLARFPAEVVEKMWPQGPLKEESSIVKPASEVSYTIQKEGQYQDLLKVYNGLKDYFGLLHPSLSLIIAPAHSTSGAALLSNDSQTILSNPSLWYEAHIRTPEHEIYGHFIPLFAFPLIGHDKNRGWAITMAEVDNLDIYDERINDKKQVMYRGSWVPLKEYSEKIKIKDHKDHEVTVRVTPHGPIINDSKNHAVKWSYHHPENNIAMAFYKLSRTKSLSDLNSALDYGATPALNISWADTKGNIAWKVMGKIPMRRGFTGNQILEGHSGVHEYERYLTINENPGEVNPESGVIVTTNERPESGGRIERIKNLLATKEKWSLDGLISIQNDQFVVKGIEVRDILLSEVRAQTEMQKEIIGKFKDWNGHSGKDSFGSVLFHMWVEQLVQLTLKDDLGGTAYMAFSRLTKFEVFLKNLIADPSSPFWDNLKTKEKENRGDIINSSFQITVNILKSYLGKDHAQWKWGDLLSIEFEHPLSRVSPWGNVFNLGPYPVGRVRSQVETLFGIRRSEYFKVKHGAGIRRLIDFKDSSVSLGILPTGNGGHFNGPFTNDQVNIYLKGGHRAQWLNKKDVKQHSHSSLVLKP